MTAMRGKLARRDVVVFLATCAYCGRSPVAPASLASLGTVLVLVLLRDSWLLHTGYPLLVAAVVVIGFVVSGRAERILGEKDAVSIVIDDAAGMLVAAYRFQQAGVDVLLVLWLLFRVIDNVKVFPLRLVERRLSGATAVMLDDLIAGVYANVAFRLAAAAWLAPRPA